MHRKELMADRHDLPSRFWEPQPDEEDLLQMMAENEKQRNYSDHDSDSLPFGQEGLYEQR